MILENERRLIAIAASAGGLRALQHLFTILPAEFPASILVVQHLAPYRDSQLAAILARKTNLNVIEAVDHAKILPGHVYIAPPNYHLTVVLPGNIALHQGPLNQFVRPSANMLFDSVATCYQSRAIAIVLTGYGSDGSQGIVHIKQNGGYTIAQDPLTAECASMPISAIKTGMVDWVASLDNIRIQLLKFAFEGGAP